MSDMTYLRDVTPYRRHWEIKEPTQFDATLELVAGDLLIFEGDGNTASPGSIARHHSSMRYGNWCTNCLYNSTEDKVTATHTKTGGEVEITFTRGPQSKHSATVTFPSPSRDQSSTGTWMADEGP